MKKAKKDDEEKYLKKKKKIKNQSPRAQIYGDLLVLRPALPEMPLKPSVLPSSNFHANPEVQATTTATVLACKPKGNRINLSVREGEANLEAERRSDKTGWDRYLLVRPLPSHPEHGPKNQYQQTSVPKESTPPEFDLGEFPSSDLAPSQKYQTTRQKGEHLIPTSIKILVTTIVNS